MANFIRRFRFDPGNETLIEIESVNILDLEPPAVISGVGTGTAMLVGEFENGPFAVPTEVTSATDLKTNFGGFGYDYDGFAGANPCARVRRSDAALQDEFWNGNGFIALANKRFGRLVVARVDTSVGEVSFLHLACVSGARTPTFDLEPGQTITIDPDGGGDATVTFDAAAASLASAAGTYPSTFVGGESMTVLIDEGTNEQIGPIEIVFTVADQTQAQVIARINSVLGYTAASDSGAGVTALAGRIRGTAGKVEVTAVSGALVTTATGFSPASAAGTGDVANIDAVTVAEVNTVVAADTAGGAGAERGPDGELRICSATPISGTIEISSVTPPTATAFGFVGGESADASVSEGGVIPAGTRVRNIGATEWVTMQDVTIPTTIDDALTVKVRPAVDDGTTGSAAPGSVIVLPFAPRDGSFTVTNVSALSAALTEAQIDAKYLEAIAETYNLNNVSAEVNLSWSARQSNAVRYAMRDNAIQASQQGALGRITFIRPPLGTTTRTIARSSASPGVGAYRDRRVVYCFPGVATYISQIGARGEAGGDGFTADGVIDAGFDGFVVSVCSQLPPEENPGQLTEFLFGVLGIEEGNADVQNLNIGDYTNFRAAGICAPRMDNGTPIIQSGVVSIDPTLTPQLRNIARQRMSDFIGDTLARRAKAFGKKAQTRSRRGVLISEQRAWLKQLQDDERIESWSVSASGNSPESLALGIFRSIIKVRTLPSFDSIVLEQTVGETVVVDDVT